MGWRWWWGGVGVLMVVGWGRGVDGGGVGSGC